MYEATSFQKTERGKSSLNEFKINKLLCNGKAETEVYLIIQNHLLKVHFR
jgi:hypothetical protein